MERPRDGRERIELSMSNLTEKLARFQSTVLREASTRKDEIVSKAIEDRKTLLSDSEMQYLKQAYESIQDAVRKIDKEINEEVSKAIVESKQALFNRRDEILDSVFGNVRKVLLKFRTRDEYKPLFQSLVKSGLEEVGNGSRLIVYVDEEDRELAEKIRAELGSSFSVALSDDTLYGGCRIVNRDAGVMSEKSFVSRFNRERDDFLETYQLSIE